MAILKQDFQTFAGDSVAVLFQVVDSDLNPTVSIATVQEIAWTAARSNEDAVVVTKRLSTGGITLPSGGTDGRFRVFLSGVDTGSLTAAYFHKCAITDSSGAVTTVETGTMNVGPAPMWTYSGDPRTSNKDAIRYLMGDVVSSEPQVMDAEIMFALSQRTSIYGAAATVCRALASKLSREADTMDKDLRDAVSQRARAYGRMAADYENQASFRSGAMPYAGGISIADRTQQINNTDRVPPQANIGMTDNFIPTGEVGNEEINVEPNE